MKDCCATNEASRTSSGRRLWALLIAVVIVVAVAALSSALNAAPVQHGGEKQEHGHDQKDKPGALPASYAAAIDAIGVRLDNIKALIASKKLDQVHTEAEVIRDIANTLAQLALKSDSGVAKEAVKDVNINAKALAAKFEPIDEAGDSGDQAATKKVCDEMVALHAALAKYVPGSYQCPMKCEGGKTYAQPGRCPVCGMDLKKVASTKYSADVKPQGEVKAGAATTLRIALKDPRGGAVKELADEHAQAVHVFAVSKDLAWIAHEHAPLQADGTLAQSFTFPAPGEYAIYCDFTPPGVGEQVVSSPLVVPGQAPAAMPLKVDTSAPKQVEGYTVRFSTKGPITVGQETEITLNLSLGGKPVTDLETYLGEVGHLAIVSQDLQRFVHGHSGGEEEAEGHRGGGDEHGKSEHHEATEGSKGPDVEFHVHFDAPGLYKSWAQFQHKGKVLTVPFTLQVEAGAPHKH